MMTFYLGWDVGGWHCDHNRNSRDAIAVLDEEGELIGWPWRGNLLPLINMADTVEGWLTGLFERCELEIDVSVRCVLAIDAPLGWPQALLHLAHGQPANHVPERQRENPYLYRLTERLLFERALRPLSAVQDMIGSQATKAMHVCTRLTPEQMAHGVWSSTDGRLIVLETYPAALKRSAMVVQALPRSARSYSGDRLDAIYCATLARLFDQYPDSVWSPEWSAPAEEGWIWVPRDLQ
ncbi:DUF429 domain-containing protein [Sulfurivirga sp.]|uniref:DUF429 domain-containing protein n=1 Tax=Sulfurivirga sp. TaxID=2614236 RepID=UPI0025E7AD93|nr:DUF429 domain-containing protein [Sulfurivirga sp.]